MERVAIAIRKSSRYWVNNVGIYLRNARYSTSIGATTRGAGCRITTSFCTHSSDYCNLWVISNSILYLDARKGRSKAHVIMSVRRRLSRSDEEH